LDVENGNLQRLRQVFGSLVEQYSGAIYFLSLGSSPLRAKKWLKKNGYSAYIEDSVFAWLAYINATVWYYFGMLWCCKLGIGQSFGFRLRTPVPRKWEERFGLVVCLYPWAYRLLELGRLNTSVVVDMNDVMAERYKRMQRRSWISISRREEETVVESATRCIAISDGDSDEFERLYNVRLPVAPFAAVESEELFSLAGRRRGMSVGYLAAGGPLNLEVLNLLLSQVFLGILKEGGVRLVIAGGICSSISRKTIRKLAEYDVNVMGRPNRLADFYGQISTMVNPTGPSTGIKVKSVEALLAGCSLIATRWGSDGSLNKWFEKRIRTVEWPVDCYKLGTLAVELAKNRIEWSSAASVAYTESAKGALKNLLQC